MLTDKKLPSLKDKYYGQPEPVKSLEEEIEDDIKDLKVGLKKTKKIKHEKK